MADDRRGHWRWENVPIPKPHVLGLIGSVAFHLYRPWRITENRRLVQVVGWPLIGTSVLVIGWAVRTIGDTAVEMPPALISDGPYAFSRNPMYVAWTALYVGISLVLNTVWSFVFLPGVLATTHSVIRREEGTLARAFDAEYRDYRDDVPRYL